MGKTCDYISLISGIGLDPYARMADFSTPSEIKPEEKKPIVAEKDTFIRDEENIPREFQSLLKTV